MYIYPPPSNTYNRQFVIVEKGKFKRRLKPKNVTPSWWSLFSWLQNNFGYGSFLQFNAHQIFHPHLTELIPIDTSFTRQFMVPISLYVSLILYDFVSKSISWQVREPLYIYHMYVYIYIYLFIQLNRERNEPFQRPISQVFFWNVTKGFELYLMCKARFPFSPTEGYLWCLLPPWCLVDGPLRRRGTIWRIEGW